MKATRHARIKEIIEHSVIETQEELANALREQHIVVTQATVSRDIKVNANKSSYRRWKISLCLSYR